MAEVIVQLVAFPALLATPLLESGAPIAVSGKVGEPFCELHARRSIEPFFSERAVNLCEAGLDGGAGPAQRLCGGSAPAPAERWHPGSQVPPDGRDRLPQSRRRVVVRPPPAGPFRERSREHALAGHWPGTIPA